MSIMSNTPTTHSDLKRSITIASAIMMASVLISRIMGLVREQVLAKYFGTSGDMNAYVASFLIPEVLNHLLAGGFLSITFIPIFQKYLMAGDKEKSWRVFSNLLTVGSLALGILIAASMIFTNSIVGLLGHGAPTELTIRLTRIIMPAQLLFYRSWCGRLWVRGLPPNLHRCRSRRASRSLRRARSEAEFKRIRHRRFPRVFFIYTRFHIERRAIPGPTSPQRWKPVARDHGWRDLGHPEPVINMRTENENVNRAPNWPMRPPTPP